MQKLLVFLFCLFLLSSCADSSEEIKKQFQDNGQGIVTDETTKLMWAARDNQQNITWQDAVDYCEQYSIGGYSDWRMPKQVELAALFKAGIKKNGEMIAISGERVWAFETDDSKGGFCHFKREGCAWGEKVMSITLRALPVRDTEPTEKDSFKVDSPASRPQSAEQRLQILYMLHQQGLVTDEEYTAKKASILNEL
jgi:Protein of unknown function (DUF1566)/Short C-terminal domain